MKEIKDFIGDLYNNADSTGKIDVDKAIEIVSNAFIAGMNFQEQSK